MARNILNVFSFKNLSYHLQGLVEGKLWLKVLIAMFSGILVGFLLGPYFGFFSHNMTEIIGGWLAVPGTLFLKMVKMIMVPLIFASIIGGITALDKSQLGKLGLNVILYFVFTTVVAVSIGTGIALWLNPGDYFESVQALNSISFTNEATDFEAKTLYKHILNILPDNPLASMVSGEMLSIVVFTIILGIAVSSLAEEMSKPIIKFIHATQEVCMIIVQWSMKIVPLAVFGLMAQITSSMGWSSILGLGMYVVSVLLGLILLLIIYALLIYFVAKRNPFTFFSDIKEVQLLAFSTTSSAAVMPLSLKVSEEKLKVDKGISNFLIPIGATINMDGTALYQCVSMVFIAQTYGIEMSVGGLILAMVTIVGASIGTPAIPGGGIIVLASVLQGIGIPTEGIVIIVGVERILGMFRAAVNVTGDLTASVIFNRFMKNE